MVLTSLGGGLSPQRVSGTLARMQPPQRVRYETIYSALCPMPRGELRAEVLKLLRRSHKQRRPRAAGEDRRRLIPNMTGNGSAADVADVADQDTDNLNRIRFGVRASNKPGVTLSNYQESRIRQVHRTLDQYMAA